MGRVRCVTPRRPSPLVDLDYAAEAADEFGRRLEADALRAFRAYPKPYPQQQDFVRRRRRHPRSPHARRQPLGQDDCALRPRGAARVRHGGVRRLWIVSRSNASTRQNILPYLYEGPAPAAPTPSFPPARSRQVRTVPDHEIIGKDGWRIVLKSNEMGRDKFAGAALDEIDLRRAARLARLQRVRHPVRRRQDAAASASPRRCCPAPGESGGVCQWLWSEKIEPWLNKRSPRRLPDHQRRHAG